MLRLTLVFLLLLSTVGRAEELPDLKTDLEKASFLLHLREFFPGLFEDAAKHDTDLLALLESQQAIEKKLREDPTYRAALAKRPNALQIKIQPVGEKTVTGRRIDPAAVVEFRQTLLGALRALPEGKSLEDILLEAIGKESEGSSASELIGKLIGQVPRDKLAAAGGFAEVLKLSPAQQTAFLRANLPDVIGTGKLRLDDETKEISRARALEKVEELRARGARAAHLAEIFMLLKHDDSPIAHDRRSALRKLEELNEGDLDIFQDGSIYEARLARLKKNGRSVNGAVKSHLAAISSRTVGVAYEARDALSLIEVPAYLATMRGCPGGDCSSNTHPLTVNSAFERVFLIRGPKGINGYVQATMVEVNGKKTLYVSTVQGWRISPGDVDLILRSLHDSAKELGVEQIAVVTPMGAKATMNNTALHGVIEDVAKRGKLVPIKISDRKFREEKIPQGNGYDHPSKHAEAHLYVPVDDGPPPRVTVDDAKIPEFKYTPPTRADLVLFALDLAEVHSKANVDRILKLPEAGISEVEFTRVKSVLNNDRGRPLAEYLTESKKELVTLGVAEPEKLRHTREYLFRAGVLAAPDLADGKKFAALSDADRTLAVEYLVSAIERGSSRYESNAIVRANHESLTSDRTFTKFLRGLAAKEMGVASRTIKELRALGMGGPAFVATITPFLDHAFEKLVPLAEGQTPAVDALFDNLDLLSSKRVAEIEKKLFPRVADLVAALTDTGRPEVAVAMRLYGAMTRHPDIRREIPPVVHDAAEKALIVAGRRYGDTPLLEQMLWQWLDDRPVPPAVIDELAKWTSHESSFEAPWESGQTREIAIRALAKAANHQQLPESAVAAIRHRFDDPYTLADGEARAAIAKIGAVSRPSCAEAWRALREGR